MGFSDEWKRILRDEVPFLRDSHNAIEENFELFVPAKLLTELRTLAGTLEFTHQIHVEDCIYSFVCRKGYMNNDRPGWYLIVTTRVTEAEKNNPIVKTRLVANWYSKRIGAVHVIPGT